MIVSPSFQSRVCAEAGAAPEADPTPWEYWWVVIPVPGRLVIIAQEDRQAAGWLTGWLEKTDWLASSKNARATFPQSRADRT